MILRNPRFEKIRHLPLSRSMVSEHKLHGVGAEVPLEIRHDVHQGIGILFRGSQEREPPTDADSSKIEARAIREVQRQISSPDSPTPGIQDQLSSYLPLGRGLP